jgi:hypothetical protein
MGVAGLSVGVIVLSMSVIVLALAFKCLPFSGLALFRLISIREVLRGRVLRIVDCVAFCVIQVVSLFRCRFWKTRQNGGFRYTYPKQSV